MSAEFEEAAHDQIAFILQRRYAVVPYSMMKVLTSYIL